MKSKTFHALVLGIITSLVFTATLLAATNPCNPCTAHGKAFIVDDARNVFTFESKAPLEKIVGTTSKITGKIHIDPKDITKHVMATFSLDLTSMKTGIGLRDKHMRDHAPGDPQLLALRRAGSALGTPFAHRLLRWNPRAAASPVPVPCQPGGGARIWTAPARISASKRRR